MRGGEERYWQEDRKILQRRIKNQRRELTILQRKLTPSIPLKDCVPIRWGEVKMADMMGQAVKSYPAVQAFTLWIDEGSEYEVKFRGELMARLKGPCYYRVEDPENSMGRSDWEVREL